jgi:hypothetical protein
MTDQEIQMLLGVVTLLSTGLLFPFVFHFFKKNERLHEQTANKIGQHDTSLAIHEVRIVSLETWRNMHVPNNNGIPTQTTTTTTVN